MDLPPLPALWGRITAEGLATLTGAHVTTARRWKRLVRPPRWLSLLVETVIEGQLSPISRDFAGWVIRGGMLYSPEGVCFTQGEIRALPFLHAQIRALQTERRLAANQAHQQRPEHQQPTGQQRRA